METMNSVSAIKGEAYNETERGFDFVPDNVTRPVRFISKLWDDTFRPEAL